MSISESVANLEKELEDIKSVNSTYANILGKSLFSYSGYSESGFVLANDIEEAISLVINGEDYEFDMLLGEDQLVELLSNRQVTSFLLTF